MRLNESPDHFYINDKMVPYTRSDAVSFIAFKGGFIVYSTAGVDGAKLESTFASGHVALADAWKLKTKIDRGLETSDEEKRDWEFYKDHIKTHGSITPEAERLVSEFVSGQRGSYDYQATGQMLKGRIWRGQGQKREEEKPKGPEPKTDKLISFWNRDTDIKSMAEMPIKLLEMLGEDPKEYTFEVGSGNYLSYYEFLNIPEDKTDYNKKYQVGGSFLTYSDFENLRTTMHTGGPIKGREAKEKLCRILNKEFIEKNPELSGFIPPDCSGADSTYGTYKSRGWNNYVRPEAEKGLSPSPDSRLSSIAEPGHALGMKGRTLGGFRGRTQKEIDAAWDDFMKKRENKNIKGVSFKEWFCFLENYFTKQELLKEDPNEVSKNIKTGRQKLTWSDAFAVTFIIFKDYTVYAPTAKGAMHNDLARWLAFKALGEKHLKRFEELNPWSGSVKEIGIMGSGTKKTIEKVSDQMQSGLDGRNAFLRTNPEAILGRLWSRNNVVSFWNHWPYVANASDRVIKFVSMFGDPSKFEYDVRNMEVSYEDMIKKSPTPNVLKAKD